MTALPVPPKGHDWIPIGAKTPASFCKSCRRLVYWSYTRLGRPVPVSIAFEGAVPPGRYDQGRGISHFVDCVSRDEHRAKAEPEPELFDLPVTTPADAAIERAARDFALLDLQSHPPTHSDS